MHQSAIGVIKLVVLSTLFVTVSAHAQSIYSPMSNTNTYRPSPSFAPVQSSPQVMSPDAARNSINSVSQQSQGSINAQLNQISKSSNPAATTPNASSPNMMPPSNQNESAGTNDFGPQNTTLTPGISQPAQTEPSDMPTFMPQTPVGQNPNRSGYRQPRPSQQQPQVYTGFGAGNPATPSTQPNQPANSGGWNIKY